MQIAGWILFLLGIIRLGIAWINWQFNKNSRKISTGGYPSSLSVLIPARNEEQNIEGLLQDLTQLKDPTTEIIVYNDQSTDRTAAIVKSYPHIRLIEGNEPDKGWLGKNYACHQLALAAKGKHLLFLDADVRINGPAIRHLLCYLEQEKLRLLSLFPRQILTDTGSRFTVPLMNWILLSILPLPLIPNTTIPSLAAANGQCMLFKAETYYQLLPHRKFRNNPVEDIAIIRYYKSGHQKTATLTGEKEVSCRMYRNWKEAIQGFAKNIFAFFGNSQVTAYLFALLTTLAPPPFIFYSLGTGAGILYLLFILGIRIFVSLASNQPVLQNIAYIIPQQFSFWVILIYATIHHRQKKINMERPKHIFCLTGIYLLISLSVSYAVTPYRQQIYQAYISGDMETWEKIIHQIEQEPPVSLDRKLELFNYYYGYTGYLIGTGQKKKAKACIEKGDVLIKEIIKEYPEHPTASAYQGSFMAYKLALNKLKTMILGPECIRQINKAYQLDSTNIQAITDKANLLYYTPGMFGGNKQEAIRYYRKEVSLLEQNHQTVHNWQYLNLLSTLAQQYEAIGEQQAAMETYEKILRIEPGYHWVKEELYLQLKDQWQ